MNKYIQTNYTINEVLIKHLYLAGIFIWYNFYLHINCVDGSKVLTSLCLILTSLAQTYIHLALCGPETPKWVLWQTVITLMKSGSALFAYPK